MNTWPRWAWITFGAGSIALVVLGVFAAKHGGRRPLGALGAKITVEGDELVPTIEGSTRVALNSKRLTFCPVGSGDAVDADRAERMIREIARNSAAPIMMSYDPDEES